MSTAPALNGDIPVGNWIDRWVPAAARPYLRLMRLDRPIGTWLLLFPCWWSVALAADGGPDLRLMTLFAIGAVIMRGAGCTINDIADHKFDAMVERTKGRPIPSGAISIRQAALFLAAQLAIGLLVLVQLNAAALWWGIGSLILVFPYPLMKRITWWPQAWLGLTFNWGALLGWVAVTGSIAPAPFLLYGAGILWTLGYDTIYAHQDKDDDSLIGVKSSALRLGAKTGPALVAFYAGAVALIGASGFSAGLSWPFYPVLLLSAGQLAWQALSLQMNDSADCLAKFKSNRLFGWGLLAAIIAGKVL
ncbi:4-hydroxybenzoate octaprenyltransferase [Magnetospirillum sulfuroxidans]|uniref:4-hydroxybenzoate octaprenyltransferase n=1 Tax=Magnetospirillum sulfuroxidans TaxID=611300 RepID=A0ABS5IBH6_9PROT|nr:4-hydroxybenzoate octaprenyltransferase [Magnetospirillum sulfuroxidans]MBR9971770.1 4-hydroxybenzoate octaprenyltransferase [Magnetospirillum sulfuroxidans]